MPLKVMTPFEPRFRRKALLRAATSIAAPALLASAAWSQLPASAGPVRTAPSSGLPAAQITENRPSSTVQPPSLATPQPYRARVEFVDERLSIAAQNSSLNEILSDIARLTGMKITGGVADERVYGNYGPDTAPAVLEQLLDGTGTNMLLLETPQHTLAELVLTPRNGGPTPPNPYAAREAEDENLPPGLGGRRRDMINGRRISLPGEVRSSEPPVPYSLPQPAVPPSATQENTIQPNPAQPDATQQSPNGVRTPREMIFDNLSNQQQQQQQPSSVTPQ